MTKQTALTISKELFDKAAKIKLNNAAAIFGTTSHESLLQNMRKHIAELSAALTAKKPYTEVMQAYEAVAADVDSAGLTGLISEAELPEYYALIDKLWGAIEKEK